MARVLVRESECEVMMIDTNEGVFVYLFPQGPFAIFSYTLKWGAGF